jgi:uncharacterized OB-fold protein
MNEKTFDSEKYGMVICPRCGSQGYIQNPERQCCPNCGSSGFIKKEAGEDKDNSSDPLNLKTGR